MTDYRSLDKSTERLFEEALQKINAQLEIVRKSPETGLKLLTRFDELKTYTSLFVHKVTELKGKSGSVIILLVEKHLTIIEQKRSARIEKEIEEIEPVMIFSISQDIGRAYIRRETIADKITDLLTKVDIDFTEYPNFSRNYCLIGERPEHIRKYLPKRLLESLEKIEGMTIEINGNWGLLRPEKNVNEKLLLLLMSIGHKMTE